LLYLVETVSTYQPMHDWYSKPSGWVLMQRQEYVKTGSKAEYQPTKQFLKNPLMRGDSWRWKGKGMMGVEIDESNDVSGPETVSVPAGKFEAMKVMTKVIQGGRPRDEDLLVRTQRRPGQVDDRHRLSEINHRTVGVQW